MRHAHLLWPEALKEFRDSQKASLHVFRKGK